MKKLELGCGNNEREMDGYENYCIDLLVPNHAVVPKGKNNFRICNLGFEHIPFEENMFDLVQAFDVVEHVPKIIYDIKNTPTKVYGLGAIEGTTKYIRLSPFIFLMNEIYRVLVPGGKLIIETPFSDQAFRRDPTHINHLSEDWFHYFQKEDNLYYDQGLVVCNFSLHSNTTRPYKWTEKDIMHTELIAVKATHTTPLI